MPIFQLGIPSNGYTKFSKKEAQECLKSAEEIIEFIKNKIDFSIYYKENS
jgi:hypothetical protein